MDQLKWLRFPKESVAYPWNPNGVGGLTICQLTHIRQETTMDKDRIKGSAEQVKGKVKEVAGKVLGDRKLEAEGQTDQVKGKIQNEIGGLKDTLRGK
jgi:uncharacterized protein YjbJ (UPF0337 family)